MAITANILLAFYDRFTKGMTFTSNTAVYSTPFALNNLGNRRLQTSVWRAALGSLSGVTLNVDLVSTRTIDVFMIHGMNATTGATCRVQFSTVSNFASTVYDTTSAVTCFDTSLGLLTGAEEFVPPWGRTFVHLISAGAVAGRYVRFTLSDSLQSVADNYIQASIVEVGKCWQPATNMGAEWSQRDYLLGGISAADDVFPAQTVLRSHEFTLPILTKAEMSILQNLWRNLGTTGRMLLVIRPTDATMWRATNVWGCFVEEPKFEAHPQLGAFGTYSAQIKFKEVRE